MNAQEAIEIVDKSLNRPSEPAEISIKNHIEALSIVLESAKHLHLYISKAEKKDGFIETYTDEGFKLVPFMTMTEPLAKKIGIEGEADE